jgi:hypothetical protein
MLETEILARLHDVRTRHACEIASRVDMSRYDPARVRALCDADDANEIDEIVQTFSAGTCLSAAARNLFEHLQYAIFAREIAPNRFRHAVSRLLELSYRT